MSQLEKFLFRFTTMARVIKAEPKLMLNIPKFIFRSLREGMPETIKRTKLISSPTRYTDEDIYNKWFLNYQIPNGKEKNKMLEWGVNLKNPPKISILLPVYNSNIKWLSAAINSVRAQTYPHWELCIADDASTNPKIRQFLEKLANRDARIRVLYRSKNGHISACTNSALSLATGTWIALLDHDDLLNCAALTWVAKSIIENPNAKLFYSDEDKIDKHGKHTQAYCKCDWNPALALGQNMFSHLGVFNKELICKLGGLRLGFEGSQDYDLLLRCVDAVERTQIVHIPRILYHMRIHPNSSASGAKPYTEFAAERALADHLKRNKIRSRVVSTRNGFRIMHAMPNPMPFVSIIISTQNQIDYLKQCIKSLLDTTNYPEFEIVIINNYADNKDYFNYLNAIAANLCIRIFTNSRQLDYAKIINSAVAQAKGNFVCLLNENIITLHADWLEELISQAVQPGVGAVGAKLLSPNGTVFHGGLILGIDGVAGFAHQNLLNHEQGYFRRAALVQEISAVDGVLMINKQLFLEAGGFSSGKLGTLYNNVDCCLKLLELGYHNIYTPFARLSCRNTPNIESDEAIEFIQKKWGNQLLNDQAYSPNLSLESNSFCLAEKPRLPTFSAP